MPGGGDAGAGAGPGSGAGACAGFATGTGATARCTGGDAAAEPRAARGVVPAGGLVSGAPIGERRRAGAGLGPGGTLGAESGTGVCGAAGAGAGAGAGREVFGAGEAPGVFAAGWDVTGSDVTGLEETGAPRPERARWTGGADEERGVTGARPAVAEGGTGTALGGSWELGVRGACSGEGAGTGEVRGAGVLPLSR